MFRSRRLVAIDGSDYVWVSPMMGGAGSEAWSRHAPHAPWLPRVWYMQAAMAAGYVDSSCQAVMDLSRMAGPCGLLPWTLHGRPMQGARMPRSCVAPAWPSAMPAWALHAMPPMRTTYAFTQVTRIKCSLICSRTSTLLSSVAQVNAMYLPTIADSMSELTRPPVPASFISSTSLRFIHSLTPPFLRFLARSLAAVDRVPARASRCSEGCTARQRRRVCAQQHVRARAGVDAQDAARVAGVPRVPHGAGACDSDASRL
eukprot:352041-Chlamydomonas_euryale.AAC.2